MSTDRKVFLGLGLALALVLVGFLLYPQAKERLAPELTRAWVAIEPQGAGAATIGPVEIDAATPFTLHAVLEAQGADGPVYYTEAPALVIDGQPVPATALRRWDRKATVRVLWLTVEGAVPYLKLRQAEDFGRFRWTEFLRLDWPHTWAIPGSIDPANDQQVVRPQERELQFGTQRYQVRIELYDDERQLVPSSRYSSWSAEDLVAQVEKFPTVYAAAPGPLAAPSLYFGLTDIALPDGAEALRPQMARLTRQRLAYEPLQLLGALLAAAGTTAEQLSWRRVELDAGPAWGDSETGVAPGDLVQVGETWVVLFRDAGKPGVLDGQDLCFDFSAGATVRALDEVFLGSGEVDIARLTASGA